MTRKDYILIAEALKAARDYVGAVSYTGQVKAGIAAAAKYIADALARDNPRFDRERFLKICGVQS